jgi:hypothetical protein
VRVSAGFWHFAGILQARRISGDAREALHAGITETHHNHMMKVSKNAENFAYSNGILHVFIEKELREIW